MTSLNPQCFSTDGIKIDTRYLLSHFPALIQIRRKQRTWSDFGSSLIRELQNPTHANRSRNKNPEAEELSEWEMAKQLIYGVLATHDSQYDGIRRRLGNFKTLSTASILSVLSIWLAGVLGVSVTVTKPMVAVILFAVAEAAGDWNVLV